MPQSRLPASVERTAALLRYRQPPLAAQQFRSIPHPRRMPWTIKPSAAQSTMDSATPRSTANGKARYFGFRAAAGNAITSPDADHLFVAEAQGYGWSYLRSWLAQIPMRRPHSTPSSSLCSRTLLDHAQDCLPPNGTAAAKSVNGSDSATDGDLAKWRTDCYADRQWVARRLQLQEPRCGDQCHQSLRDQLTTHPPLLGDWSPPGDKYYNATRPIGLHDRPLPRLQGRNGRCHLGTK